MPYFPLARSPSRLLRVPSSSPTLAGVPACQPWVGQVTAGPSAAPLTPMLASPAEATSRLRAIPRIEFDLFIQHAPGHCTPRRSRFDAATNAPPLRQSTRPP